jgi:hypothetical protein
VAQSFWVRPIYLSNANRLPFTRFTCSNVHCRAALSGRPGSIVPCSRFQPSSPFWGSAIGMGAYDLFHCASTVRYGPDPRQRLLIGLRTRFPAGGTIAHPVGLSCLCILRAAHVDVLLAQRQALPNPWR